MCQTMRQLSSSRQLLRIQWKGILNTRSSILIIVSVEATYKTGFGLDDWIY
jgi:hypothetical protein